MADKNLWSNYTEKDTLTDEDEVMVYDSEGKTNKRSLMEKFWDYIVEKMATAVISKLETENKTVIGALNYLNGNTNKIIYVDAGVYSIKTYTADQAARDIIDTKLKNSNTTFFFVDFINGSRYKMIVQKYEDSDYASYILFGYGTSTLIYHVKTGGIWQ